MLAPHFRKLRSPPALAISSSCKPFIFKTVSSKQLHTHPNDDTHETAYSSLLRKSVATSNPNDAKSIHAELVKSSIVYNSLFLRNHLINAYVKCGEFDCALQLFDEMPHKNVVSWTALISGFEQKGFAFKAFFLFSQMHRSGIVPNEFSFVSALKACSFADCLSLVNVHQVLGLIVKMGYESNIFLVNAFLIALIRHCRLEEAFLVFEKCTNRDVVSWNTMMGGYVQFCCSELQGFWRRMIRDGVEPDGYTFSSVLTGLAELSDLQMGMQVHAILVKSGYGGEMCVGNSLVDMYLKNQFLAEGIKAFEEIPVKDVCSWTQMAANCLSCGEPEESIKIIEEMRLAGVKPNKFTLATAFNACANSTLIEEGKKFHGLRIKLGDDIDVCVDNALIDMYAKCGCMDGSSRVFKSMLDHSIVTWTTMIMGYAQNGRPRESLKIFEDMRKEGIVPNYITFICVLYACSQGGYVDEGWNYFSSVSHDYNITPGEDHYACMVNLLGRAGRIREAEELIMAMPVKPGVLVWQTLLGACRLHGDMETAKRAAGNALDIDGDDPSTYVLLSNTLAGLDNWDSVGLLRELMESREIKKVPGSSWF